MMVDAMLAAEPYLKIAGQIDDPKKYLGLTDDIRTEDPALRGSREPNYSLFSVGPDINVTLGTLRGTADSRAHTESRPLSLR
jgi:hypothetical protein